MKIKTLEATGSCFNQQLDDVLDWSEVEDSSITRAVEEIINEVLKLMPEDMPIKKIPTQYIGFSPEHAGFDGTITLPSVLLTSIIFFLISLDSSTVEAPLLA